MRWFITVLIVANLAIFVWSSLHKTEPEQAALAAPGVGNIRLLRELNPADFLQKNSGQGAVHTQAATVPAPIQADTEVKLAPLPQAAPADNVAALEAPIVEAELEQKAAVPQLPVCGRLRGFSDRASAEKTLELLQRQQIEAAIGSDGSEKISGYWVLIPAAKDRAAGKAKLAELKAAGVEDVWLFAKGPLKNAISLGLFSAEGNAGRRAKQVEKSGFKPVIRPKISEKAQFWVDYAAPADISIIDLDLPGIGKLKNQARKCP